MKQSLHIHSTYADGKDKPEEMILTAIERGFTSIGFSEHSYMPFSSYPYQMKIEEMDAYKAEIRFLKEKYKGIIDIFCGMELESFSVVPQDGFDYIIGSVHYVEVNGAPKGFDGGLESTLEYLKTHFNGDAMLFAKKYFETVAALPEKGNIDIIGHFDLLTKNNEKGKFLDTSSEKYLNFGYEAIHALKGKIPFFEVNTGAISRGYTSLPYPQMEFLKEFKKCGFGAMISSDCHDKNFIDCYFEQSKQLLLQAGFDTLWILTDNGYVEAKI